MTVSRYHMPLQYTFMKRKNIVCKIASVMRIDFFSFGEIIVYEIIIFFFFPAIMEILTVTVLGLAKHQVSLN